MAANTWSPASAVTSLQAAGIWLEGVPGAAAEPTNKTRSAHWADGRWLWAAGACRYRLDVVEEVESRSTGFLDWAWSGAGDRLKLHVAPFGEGAEGQRRQKREPASARKLQQWKWWVQAAMGPDRQLAAPHQQHLMVRVPAGPGLGAERARSGVSAAVWSRNMPGHGHGRLACSILPGLAVQGEVR